MSDSFADTIKPKSDQLNADDLLVGPITVKILDVKRGPDDQPVHIYIEGQQPYKPNKSMRRVLIVSWGDKGINWIGRSMTLYREPSVKWAGAAVGGIQISHLSDIATPITTMLTVARGKKISYTVHPLTVKTEQDKPALDENAIAWIKAVKKKPELIDTIEDQQYRQFIKDNLQ